MSRSPLRAYGLALVTLAVVATADAAPHRRYHYFQCCCCCPSTYVRPSPPISPPQPVRSSLPVYNPPTFYASVSPPSRPTMTYYPPQPSVPFTRPPAPIYPTTYPSPSPVVPSGSAPTSTNAPASLASLGSHTVMTSFCGRAMPYPTAARTPAYFSAASSGGSLASSGYPDPYGAGFSATYADPYAGYLEGAAQVVAEQGRYAINFQQGNLLREQVKQAKLENRRRVLDGWLEFRDKTPTIQDERERSQKQDLRRARNDPPATEIYSAKALNDLLADLQTSLARGVRLPSVALDADVLRRVNVTVGGGHVGLLRDGGRLRWPQPLLRDELKGERESLDTLTQEVVRQAAAGRMGKEGLSGLDKGIERLRKVLAARVSDLPPRDYVEAQRFVSSLASAVTALRRPDGGGYFNGKYVAKGETVEELVRHMGKAGLTFAPATPGDEEAYAALHQALVSSGATAFIEVAEAR